MLIKIIFDKDAFSDVYTGWGISFLIEEKILFDTGENCSMLLQNMEKLNVNLDALEAVVISHDHWDHTGGLWEVLRIRRGISIYACPNFSSEFKNKIKELHGKLIEVDTCTEIIKNIFSTGEIPGEYKGNYMPEQALTVKTENGISVITGCSHPGIMKILKRIKEWFPEEKLYFVGGGFHLMDKSKREIQNIAGQFKEIGVEKIGPAHCTGKEAEEIFKKTYGRNFIPIRAGKTFTI